MKFNRFFIVTILLAILTIGAVSATDDLALDGAIAAESDDSSLQSDSSDEQLGEIYSDNDFYVKIQENYTQDVKDWSTKELIYISSKSKENGTFSILVNDVENKSLNLTNGYFSIEKTGDGKPYEKKFQYIYPNDLGLNLGNYNIKVKFNEKTLTDTSVLLKQKEDFDIITYNPYYANKDYWPTSVFIQIDSNHANTGVIEVYVNGTKKLSYNVNNGYFDEIPNARNTTRHIAASDLVSGYGTYNIKITFTENGTIKTLLDDNVVMAERAPTTDPKLELYFDFYTLTLPADNIARIYLPWEATGNLTISYNNVKNFPVSYSKGSGTSYMNAWDLNHLGINTVTVTYTGDDFGTLTVSKNITVLPKVTAPSMVSAGEEFTISVLTHDWVYGTFNVYEYKDGKKGKLLASDALYPHKYHDWATASVTLSSYTVGKNRYYLEFDYPGGDYPIIQEISVFQNSKNIAVGVPGNVEVGNDFNVTFKGLDSPFTFVYITVDDNPSTFNMLENGTVIKTVSGLPLGYHTVHVYYNNGKYADDVWTGEVYSKTFTVTVGNKTKISAPQISTTYNVAKNLVVTLKDVNGKSLGYKAVTIVLNGNTYDKTTDSNGQVKLSVNLPAKTYTATFKFAGDDKYFPSSGSTKVIVNKATPKLTASAKTFKVNAKTKKVTATLKTNTNKVMKNTAVSLKINKKTYSSKTNSKGVATFSVKLTKKGKYNAVYRYAGSSNYKAVNKTVKITVK